MNTEILTKQERKKVQDAADGILELAKDITTIMQEANKRAKSTRK